MLAGMMVPQSQQNSSAAQPAAEHRVEEEEQAKGKGKKGKGKGRSRTDKGNGENILDDPRKVPKAKTPEQEAKNASHLL